MRRFGRALAMSLVGIGEAKAADCGDPQGSGVIVGAVDWLQGTLMRAVAPIAVAFVGFMMLTGAVNWRHGAMGILGCFVLFGAASVVTGIRATHGGFLHYFGRNLRKLHLLWATRVNDRSSVCVWQLDGLAQRAGQKIIRQRQLVDLGV